MPEAQEAQENHQSQGSSQTFTQPFYIGLFYTICLYNSVHHSCQSSAVTRFLGIKIWHISPTPSEKQMYLILTDAL